MFIQCVSGECINVVNVCDNIPDCFDASDELICHYHGTSAHFPMFTCKDGSQIPSHQNNDLMPDCPSEDAEDEMEYKDVLSSELQYFVNKCNHSDFIPCVKGHSLCFP